MKIGRTLLTVILLFIGLLAVNYLASALPLRLDTTAGKIYTLSPGTKKILGRLEEPVRLEFYFSRNIAGLPVSFKNYASRVQEMLRQYVRASAGKIELSVRLGQKDVSGQLNKVVRLLRNDGAIELTIPDNPNSRLQKYRLVAKNL